MHTEAILAAIDAEIAKLKQVREIVAGGTSATSLKRSPGRPKGSVTAAKSHVRTMSPEGRARVAAAQKARWALLKAQAEKPKKSAKKS